MYANSPADCVFALDLDALKAPEITFWSAWDGDEVLGCGALNELSSEHGEIKSMRTAAAHLRKGVAQAILHAILAEAKRRAYRTVSLETGTTPAFLPSHALYQRLGFTPCGPFGNYRANAFSVFMSKSL